VDGGALYMTPQLFPTVYRNAAGQVVTLDKPKLLFYVAYGAAGVIKLDWSNVVTPTMMGTPKGVVGGASATAINNGRVYVAAGAGGLSVLK